MARRSLTPGDSENVKVVCRVRPFSRREIDIQEESNAKQTNEWDKRPLRSVVEMSGNVTVFLDHEKDFAERERFEFDLSLWSIETEQQASANEFASQEVVMGCVGEPTIAHVWSGYHTCVLAYGQTGSGKTYTMMGENDQLGLIPRICKSLFASLEQQRQKENGVVIEGAVKEYLLEATFLEIYNEKVKDLLWELRPVDQPSENIDKDNLKVRNLTGLGPQVVGLTCVRVTKWEECLALIEEGTRHRSVAATKMNPNSSRSHSIFRLSFVQRTKVLPTKQFERPKHFDRVSQISLVDLAGSERNKKTGAVGDRLREAVAINLSLTTLKNVIDALVESRPVIPFRDSQLTWLLSENLGGNSKTFMIACISPHWDNAEESLNTLRYALRTQGIVCHAKVNESDELKKMNKMRDEMERLSKQIKENPNQEALHHEYEEQKMLLNQLVANSQQAQRETERLSRDMERGQQMRYSASFHHSFRTLFLQKLNAKYKEINIQLREKENVKIKEMFLLQRRVLEKEQGAATLKIEEKVASDFLKAKIEQLESLKAKHVALETDKQQMGKVEAANAALISKGHGHVRLAKDISTIMAAYQSFLSSRQAAKLLAQNVQATETVSDAELNKQLLCRQEQQERTTQLEQQQLELTNSVGERRKSLHDRQKKLNEHVARLHAECIFLENENKQAFAELTKKLSAIGTEKSERMTAEKDRWTAKIKRLQAECEASTAARLDDLRGQYATNEAEYAQEIIAKGELGAKNARELAAKQSVQIQDVNDQWASRSTCLENHIEEVRLFLKEIAHKQPRYATVHAEILTKCAKSSDTSVMRLAKTAETNRWAASLANPSEILLRLERQKDRKA